MLSGRPPSPDPPPLASVLEETRLLFHGLRAAAAELHGEGESSAGRRNVLSALSRSGPQTVPQLARARPVSRQHMQVLVNALLADRLVARASNPAHRKSDLIEVTDRGRRVFEAMERREAQALRRLPAHVADADLRRATGALRRIREAFASSAWKRIAAKGAPR